WHSRSVTLSPSATLRINSAKGLAVRFFAALLMNKAVRLRSTRRAGALQMSPLPAWESAAAAAHSTIAGLQRGTRPTAPASWSAGRERRFARQKAGLHPAIHKASAARGGAPAVLCRLEERDALWG